MEAIARRAGVGVGTLYRNFPQRIDLVEAVYSTDVKELSEAATAAVETLEPWPSVVAFFEAFVRYARTKQTLLGELQQAFEKNPDLRSRSRELINGAFDLVIDRAKEAGAIRDDVSGSDVTSAGEPGVHQLGASPRAGGAVDVDDPGRPPVPGPGGRSRLTRPGSARTPVPEPLIPPIMARTRRWHRPSRPAGPPSAGWPKGHAENGHRQLRKAGDR